MTRSVKVTAVLVSLSIAAALYWVATSDDVATMTAPDALDPVSSVRGAHAPDAGASPARGRAAVRDPEIYLAPTRPSAVPESPSDIDGLKSSTVEDERRGAQAIIGKNCPEDGGVAKNCIRCMTNADCGKQETCGVDHAGGISCLESDCDSDEDCEPGFSCRQVGIPGQSSGVSQCRRGTAKEGQACSIQGPPELTCDRLLTCGPDNRCVRACDPSKKEAQCREGEMCAHHSWTGGYCHTPCKLDADCDPGETCVRYGIYGSLCRVQVGTVSNCSTSTCPAGMACQIFLNARSVAFDCASCCSPIDPHTCMPNEVCGQSHSSDCLSVCYRSCAGAKDCGPGETCSTVNEEGTVWGCVSAVTDLE